MPIADGDILRVTAKMVIGEDDVQNVYHVQAAVTETPEDAPVLAVIGVRLDAAYGALVSSIASTVDFISIETWNLTQDELVGVTDWPTLTDGGNELDQIPQQCAALVLFNTATARSQGRKFLPPFGVNNVDPDGTIIAGTLANILSYANFMLATLVGVGWTGDFGNWNPVLVRFAEWTANQVRDIYATQRRRYIGSGS